MFAKAAVISGRKYWSQVTCETLHYLSKTSGSVAATADEGHSEEPPMIPSTVVVGASPKIPLCGVLGLTNSTQGGR